MTGGIPASPFIVGEIRAVARVGEMEAGWLRCNGAAVSRTTYALLFSLLVKSATVTTSIASPCVVSWTAHGLSAGHPIKFSTTGALPTGIVAGTTYYLSSTGFTPDAFQISATIGGASINTSGTQSGVHTGISAPYGDGDGSTTFNVPGTQGRTIIDRGTGSGLTLRGLGQLVGAETHPLTSAENAAHTHVIQGTSLGGAGAYMSLGNQEGTPGDLATDSSGSGNAHNNMQPSIAFTHYIRAVP